MDYDGSQCLTVMVNGGIFNSPVMRSGTLFSLWSLDDISKIDLIVMQ